MIGALERTTALAEAVHARLVEGNARDPFADEIGRVVERLREPLRVAIVGRVKAGKSTLLNALVGERLAPTDAGECTRVVSWYRHGSHYRVEAVLRGEHRVDLPFSRADGRLEFAPPEGITLDQIARFEISWPSNALRSMTLIDTPGLASLDDSNSARTRDFLALGDDRPAQADMVLYVMRHLHSRDAEYLDALSDRSQSATSAASAMAILSRADEIGGGRVDAMASAHRIAVRYENDERIRTMCARVLPVTALLGETGATLSEVEMGDLRQLSELPPETLEVMLLAADELCSTGLAIDLPVEVRRALLDRFGMFGLRIVVDRLRGNAAVSASSLAPTLVDISGIPNVVRTMRESFLPRTGTLKSRAGLLELRRIATAMGRAHPELGPWLATEVERIEASAEEFLDLRLAQLLAQVRSTIRPADLDELLLLVSPQPVGGRLGLHADAPRAECRAAAVALGDRWRARVSVSLLEGPMLEVAELAVRLADRLAGQSD